MKQCQPDQVALLQAIRTTPIIDNHAHPLLKLPAQEKYSLLAIASEANGDAQEGSKSSLAHFRAVNQLAAALDCTANWGAVSEALQAKRAESYPAWVTQCLSGVETVLVDDGLDGQDDAELYSYFDSFTRSKCKRIVRIEQIVPGIIQNACSKTRDVGKAFQNVIQEFRQRIRGALSDPEVTGFKSIICYRTGLDIPAELDEEAALQVFTSVHNEISGQRGRFERLDHRGLNELFVHLLAQEIQAAEELSRKPVQFHTGLGDNDLDLTTASPAHLQPFIRSYDKVPFVLLHSGYPYVREMGYLAAMYANVYADIGEVFPFLSRDGQEGVVRQILELCPTSKILWSTDGHWFPETYLLAVEQMRGVFGSVLVDYVKKGDLTWGQSIQVVKDVLFNNSNFLYKLNLVLKPLPALAAEHCLSPVPRPIIFDDSLRYLRLCWNDMTAMPRMRMIPMRQVREMLKETNELTIGVTEASLGINQSDVPAPGITATGEYRLHADMSLLRPGPRAGHAVVFGDFKYQGDLASPYCPRSLLRGAITLAATQDVTFLLGFEIEFVLLHPNWTSNLFNPNPSHAWSSSRAMENDDILLILEAIVEQLAAADIHVEMIHSESAPGQYEIVLPKAQPLQAVDALLFSRDVISNCAKAKGFKMTLHPKPYHDACGTAAHVHMSISSPNGQDPTLYEPFYAGILTHLRAICAFTYSNIVSYDRVVDGCWAGGTWVAWGTQNRETPLRKIKDSHWELKSMDGLANPYLAMAAVLFAGLDGLRKKLALSWKDCSADPASLTVDERATFGVQEKLPASIHEALAALQDDESLCDMLGSSLVERYVSVKTAEATLLEGRTAEARRKWIIERY